MCGVRAQCAATPRVAPHRPGPAPPHAAGMLISSGHSSTSVESALASLQLGAAEMRRWWRAGAGAACSGWNAGTRRLFCWKLSAASQPERSRGRRAEPGGRRPARQHRHRHHHAVSSPAPSLDTMSGLCSYYYTDHIKQYLLCGCLGSEAVSLIDNREDSSLDLSLEKFLKFVVSLMPAQSLQTQTQLILNYLSTLK